MPVFTFGRENTAVFILTCVNPQDIHFFEYECIPIRIHRKSSFKLLRKFMKITNSVEKIMDWLENYGCDRKNCIPKALRLIAGQGFFFKILFQ